MSGWTVVRVAQDCVITLRSSVINIANATGGPWSVECSRCGRLGIAPTRKEASLRGDEHVR